MVKHRIWSRNRRFRNKNTRLIWSPDPYAFRKNFTQKGKKKTGGMKTETGRGGHTSQDLREMAPGLVGKPGNMRETAQGLVGNSGSHTGSQQERVQNRENSARNGRVIQAGVTG